MAADGEKQMAIDTRGRRAQRDDRGLIAAAPWSWPQLWRGRSRLSTRDLGPPPVAKRARGAPSRRNQSARQVATSVGPTVCPRRGRPSPRAARCDMKDLKLGAELILDPNCQLSGAGVPRLLGVEICVLVKSAAP
jgi:hypothetical protein